MAGADYLVQMLGGRISLQGPVDELDKSAITSELVEEPQDEENVESVADKPSDLPVAEESASAPAPALTENEDNKLVKEETRATGRVKLQVYKTYLSAGGWWTWLAIILLSIIGRFSRTCSESEPAPIPVPAIAHLSPAGVIDRIWLKIWGESVRFNPISLISRRTDS